MNNCIYCGEPVTECSALNPDGSYLLVHEESGYDYCADDANYSATLVEPD